MTLWTPKKKPLYAPMLSTFGGGSVRGFGGGGAAGGGGVTLDAISALYFVGQGAISASNLENLRANIAAANTDLGLPSASTFDVFGGGQDTGTWNAASNNTYTDKDSDGETVIAGNYDCGWASNGSGTNDYAMNVMDELADNEKGFGVGMFITGAYQATDVYGNGSGQIKTTRKIGMGTDYENSSAAGNTSSVSSFASSCPIILSDIGTVANNGGGYRPAGGLSTFNSATGFGTGMGGSGYLFTAKNGSANNGRLIASYHDSYLRSGSSAWNSNDTAYSSLGANFQNSLKLLVMFFYWLSGQGDDI